MSFEAYLAQDLRRPSAGRRITVAVSVALHAAAVALAIVYSFWHVDELSLPTAVVTFYQALVPPPPPAQAAKTAGHPRTHSRTRPTTPTIVQPTPTPVATRAQPGEQGDPGEQVGHGGGTEGGIEGAEGTQPAATFLPPRVATGRLAVDPLAEAHRPHLPAALAHSGMSLWAMLKVCVRPDGQVDDVKVLRGADPSADPTIVAAIRTWRYHPFTVDGRPVPFCTNVRYEISTR